MPSFPTCLSKLTIWTKFNLNLETRSNLKIFIFHLNSDPVLPAHCGLRGKELADTLAKQEAHLEQIDSTTTYSEEKTIIKSCLKRKWKLEHPYKADAYNQLERHEQVVIFRLRTNHNKLKQHLYRTFKAGDTDQCSCGEEAQTAEHILQRCQLYKELRVRT